MKKILALFMMFLVAGNFVFAQVDGTTGTEGEATATVSVQPKLNFQAVVRNADNELVFEKEMKVVINITSGENVYSETHEGVMTNKNGLMTVIIGEDATDVQGSMYDVDWSNATIEAALTFTPDPVINEDGSTTEQEETTVTVTSEVTAVPYALQAGSSKLNTEMIVNYISGIKLGTEADKYDVLKILDAIRLNEQGLKEALKDTIVEYMKTRMDIAREIFHYYLDHVDSADVWNTYEQLMANPTAKKQVRNVIIDFIKTHKADALEVLEYYAENVTVSDLQELFLEFENNPTLKAAVKAVVATELEGYLTENNYVSTNGCEGVEICALANAGKPCPTSNAFIGAINNVSGILQTTISNPDALALTATYSGTYTVGGETVSFSFAGSKDGENLIKASEEIPAGATNVTGTITVHVYGCSSDFTKSF